MSLKFNSKYSESIVSPADIKAIAPKAVKAMDTLMSKTGEGNDFLGWIDLPTNYDKEEFDRIKKSAEYIKKNADVLIVIGIGGSYLGARAVVEAVKSYNYNLLAKDTPQIYFIGNSISPSSLNEIVSLCDGKDVCVNVISKSGTTTEPAIAFRVFRELINSRYSKEEAAKRIFCTTDAHKGTLKELADKEGYETFVVPDDVGGRFSVLTAVGLLPIAVAGIDIDALMLGARNAQNELCDTDIEKNPALKYAAVRNCFYNKGKKMECFVSYEPNMTMFNEWLKQLFGESEGKDGKGIFPASVDLTTDLHSMGQWIQDGERTIFETVISVEEPNHKVVVPTDEANLDGLNFLAGKRVDEVNKMAELGTQLAHVDGGVPNLKITMPEVSPYYIGQLFYFFERACGISGYMLGVNPFDQPGVEAYKKNMFALLNKPGYEKESEAIRARL